MVRTENSPNRRPLSLDINIAAESPKTREGPFWAYSIILRPRFTLRYESHRKLYIADLGHHTQVTRALDRQITCVRAT